MFIDDPDIIPACKMSNPCRSRFSVALWLPKLSDNSNIFSPLMNNEPVIKTDPVNWCVISFTVKNPNSLLVLEALATVPKVVLPENSDISDPTKFRPLIVNVLDSTLPVTEISEASMLPTFIISLEFKSKVWIAVWLPKLSVPSPKAARDSDVNVAPPMLISEALMWPLALILPDDVILPKICNELEIIPVPSVEKVGEVVPLKTLDEVI